MFWPGTLLGIVAGWALASIPGAMLGALLGQVLDRRMQARSWRGLLEQLRGGPRVADQDLLFLLLGRLAKSRGRVVEAHIQQARVEMQRLRLDDGSRVEAAIAVAADGAESTLRTLAGLPVSRHDYGQRGVVAFVQSERPHEDTAWQRFLPTGPLAVLPFTEGRSSIVWTLPEAEAQRVLALDEQAFGRELTAAFAARLGAMRPLSPRAGFALRRQLVADYVSGRVLALGDAAHVVHPLAGQGVNLGLRDVSALRALVRDAARRRVDWTAPQRLRRWARTRRSENAVAAYGFDAINTVFSNDEMHLTLLRGSLLGAAGRMPPLLSAFWKRAAGL